MDSSIANILLYLTLLTHTFIESWCTFVSSSLLEKKKRIYPRFDEDGSRAPLLPSKTERCKHERGGRSEFQI